MGEQYHLGLSFWLCLSLSLIALTGSGQDVEGSTDAGDNSDLDSNLDSSLLVPSASALPDEVRVNTVAPALGPGVNYTSIQEAIDNSDPGDVIRVQSGTYDEVVTVNKPGLSLEGVDSEDGSPVVSGDGVESTVTLASDGCTIEGFVIMNSGNPHAGISVISNNNTITRNTIIDNRGYGIHLNNTRDNSVWSNNVSANGFSGICLQNSVFSNLTSNIASANNLSGIELVASSQNLIQDNVASDGGRHGIRLIQSDENVLRGNIASNNTLEGISIEDSHGTVAEGNVVIDVEKIASQVEETTVNFTIVVTNSGQVDFGKVTVADRLPSGLDYLSDNRSGGLDDGVISWTLTPLAANESATIELSAQISGSISGNLINSVRVTGMTAGGAVVSKESSAIVFPLLVVGSNGSISKVIELARPGDVVLVESGTYHECIVLEKNITLRGVDTGGGPPAIVGDGVGSTVTLAADGCAIEGFEVTGSGNPHAGIEIVSNNNSISNNVIRGNKGYGVRIFEARENIIISNEIRENGFDGVSVEGSEENVVSDNIVSVNQKSGICLDGSFGNVLSANTISSNEENGIGLLDSDENSLQGNVIRGNSGHGVQLIGSEMNIISGNVASYNKNDGIHLEGSNENDLSTNTAEGNLNGLRLINSRVNTLSDNNVNKNKEQGIRLRGSDENTLSGNAVDENLFHGFYLIRSDNNTFSDNNANGNNGAGIRLDSSSNNTFSGNTATENAIHGIYHYSSSYNMFSDNTANDNGNTGIRLDSSSNNTLSGNTATGNGYTGIRLISSSGNTLSENNANDNDYYGIRLDSSSNNKLTGNTATENAIHGIYHYSSRGNTLSGNTANDNSNTGIRLDSSSNNTLSGNTATGNDYTGIRLISSSGNTISGNTANDNDYYGIRLDSSSNTLSENNANGNDLYGIYLSSSSSNTLSGNTANDNGNTGIRLDSSSNNTLSDNTATGNGYTGIRLISSSSNTLSDNAANDNLYYGIRIDSSSDNTLSGNTANVNNLYFGIYLFSSSNNMFSDNTANANGNSGIFLESSSSNTLSDNTANGNNCSGIRLISSSNNNKLSDNSVSGNGDYGIRLESSSNNTLLDNSASGNGGAGIRIDSSSNNTLSGNTATRNVNNGIYHRSSSNNMFSGNTVNDNGHSGIFLSSSSNNTLSDNTATGNTEYGILLYGSSGNTLSDNTATGNTLQGIYLTSSSGNTIYLNTFNNTINAWSDSTNHWNSTEPIAPYSTNVGNCWSDYPGWDCNGDGIGDVPYPIPGGSEKDYYPLTDHTGTRTITVCGSGCNYTSIQAAINAACPGDTIEVQSGTYYENVVVNKTLKLTGVGNPVVDAGGVGNAITVAADGCTIEGFVATNSHEEVPPAEYHAGIYVTSNGNNISGNNATGNKYDGIFVDSSSDNSIWDNTITGNQWDGICLWSASSNTVLDNELTNNKASGIYLRSSSNNTISDNNRAIGNGKNGICLESSDENTIEGNNANDNGYFGIWLTNSGGNIISYNIANDNIKYGIYLNGESSGNTIYLNTFNNVNNAWSDSANHWNSTVPLEYTYNGTVYTNYTGNYWSDYSGNDSNEDGIGDTPYDITPAGTDYYPLISGVNLTTAATSLAPAILVDLSGDLVSGSPSNSVNLTVNATNLGPDNLTSIRIVALIPAGMSYLSGFASVEPDSIAECENGTWTAAWENLSDLRAGESVWIDFAAKIDGDLLGDLLGGLTSLATATGSLEERADGSGGENATGQGSWTVFVQDSVNASVSVEKTADPPVAEPGDQVTFSININNTGDVKLTKIAVADLLPAGMSYVSASMPPLFDPIEHPNGTVFLNWTSLSDLAPNDSTSFDLVAKVDDDARGSLTNTAYVAATYVDGDAIGFVNASDSATVQLRALKVTKVADEDEVKRGEKITYNITVCNVGSLTIMDLVIEDVFDHQVEVISESVSRGLDGRWRIDLLGPGDCISIILVVKVPRQEFEFEMASRAEGEGFVNVASGYSTTLDPFVIRNLIYAISETMRREYSDSASVTVLGEPGTELATHEHGSGTYESDEHVEVRTENKSITMEKEMSATYSPTVLGLYNNRTVTYSSRWSEEAKARNRVTGTSMSESYRYATSIDRDSRFFLDENESVMELESDFDGVGHIGFLKKDVDSSSGSAPLFESREDYVGSFKVLERADEYSSGIGYEKSASGSGLVVVDKRVGESQRSYESGAGSYDSDELTRTETNYIAKDLSVTSGGVEMDLTDGFSVNSSMKWNEGMWSRVANTSFIGEEYTSTTELDKDTIAWGLNEMETLANFTGKGRYRAIFGSEAEIEIDDVYEGTYSVERKILLEGAPTYDRPHLSLRKDGEVVYPSSYASPLASYTITIENDGDKSLGPVIVSDLFPPGATYVNSSLRPELTEGRATWTLTHLAIGDKFEIGLWLNLTGYRGDEIVNQVEAEGGYNGNWARADNFSAIDIDWLRCSPSGDIVTVTKSGHIDANESNVVGYTIAVENVGEEAVAAVVTDYLPDGMVVMEASPEFASSKDGVVTWNLVNLMPGETRSINYRAEAEWGGRFVNRVRVDANLVDGSGTSAAHASSVVEVGEFEGEIQKLGWQPPDWGINYTESSADLTCEEICEIS